jgi:hypothetical protein
MGFESTVTLILLWIVVGQDASQAPEMEGPEPAFLLQSDKDEPQASFGLADEKAPMDSMTSSRETPVEPPPRNLRRSLPKKGILLAALVGLTAFLCSKWSLWVLPQRRRVPPSWAVQPDLKQLEASLSPGYDPMIISANFGSLEGLSREQQDFVRETFQDAFQLLSKAFKIRRGKGSVIDLKIFVHTEMFFGGALMGALVWDRQKETSRPCSGKVVLGVMAIKALWSQIHGRYALRVAILHELFHVLGFSSKDIMYFINPKTLERKHFHPNNFICYRRRAESSWWTPRIEWDVDCDSPGVRYHWAGENTFKAPDTELCKGAPVDPTISYSEKDVEVYLKNKSRCPIRLIIPRVAEKVKKLFPETDEPGLLYEVHSVAGEKSLIVGSHWIDARTQNDAMGPASKPGILLVNPYTLAFLEESGWYQIDDTVFGPQGEFRDYVKLSASEERCLREVERLCPYIFLQLCLRILHNWFDSHSCSAPSFS